MKKDNYVIDGNINQFLFLQIVMILLTLTPTDIEAHNSRENHRNETFQCLKSVSEASDVELSCKSETLAMLDKHQNTFVDATSHRGSSIDNLRLALRDTNLNMRENYAKLINSVGRNIFPLIVASDCESPELCGVGGTFKLYLKDGSMKRTAKIPDEFEIYKFLSHLVLGVFSIVSPYFKTVHSTSWIPPLQALQAKLQNVCDALPLARHGLTAADFQMAFEMAKIVNDFAYSSIQAQRVEESSFSAFAKRLVPNIEKCMKMSAELQTGHIIPALEEWKRELGDAWNNTFVVVPTVWGVSSTNVRLLLLEQVMDFEQMSRQVIVVDGARTEDEAITTLGRVVSDRTVARLVFGGIDNEDAKDHQFSLSTRRDILSTYTGRAIKERCQNNLKKGVTCPMAKQFSKMYK